MKLKDHNLLPWFGNKRAVAGIVWDYLGNPQNFVEPFAGSAAVLIGRPGTLTTDQREVINDKDGLLVNFWRASKYDAAAVLAAASEPAFESDLHARHAWLIANRAELVQRLEGDPEYYDAKSAGWWMWGVCQWIGSGWCSGSGSWAVVDRKLVPVSKGTKGGQHRKIIRPDARGIVAEARKDGLNLISRPQPRGIIGSARTGHAPAIMKALQERLRQCYIMCGDWARVCTPSVDGFHINSGPIGVFLDPPYSDAAGRDKELYAEESGDVAHAVREWAIEKGDNPRYRIVLAGYEGEHDMPDSWLEVRGKVANGIGFGNQNKSEEGYKNEGRERLWVSPHCVNRGLFS